MDYMILGIDEVGRGPWAGPLVVGAVVLGIEIDGLTDSKKLTKKRREEFNQKILEQALGTGLGWVEASEIDTLGLGSALELGCRRAVEALELAYDGGYTEIIIDGTINFLKDTGKGPYVTTMKKADLLVPSVSAASIIAKVARDRYMEQQHALYPNYGFDSHVGYGTAAHRAAIELHGVTPLHRLSFAPLAKYATSESSSEQKKSGSVRSVSLSDAASSKQIGDRAENVVAEYLHREGHEILERNWKTKFCEIDIISRNDDTVYFTEVKYRKNANQGGGIAVITPRKLRQMKFGAEYFALKHKLVDTALRLAVAEVSEHDFSLNQWLVLDQI